MLSQEVENYLALRRSLGFKLVDTAELLRSFVTFAAEQGDVLLRAGTAIKWAARGTSMQRRYRRLRTVALFADHLRAEDPRHDPMPGNLFLSTSSPRHPPRIFTTEEIARVLALTASLWPTDSIRPITYRTLFGLLFTTGMRISEALHLRFEDVCASSVTIRQTKFRKSRWLPLHASTAEALDLYLAARRAVTLDSDTLFVSWRRRRMLGADHVLRTFQTLCANAGIEGAGGRRKPRLHDLRHSFAVHALQRCGAKRDAVERHMLALSTYLGHASVASTYWYLEQTPELMRDIADACDDRQAGGVT